MTPCKRSACETETPVFDSHHNDPEADIILVSSDQVSFPVGASHMKGESDFIRDLLDFPYIESIKTAPIQLSQESNLVWAFIDIVYSSDPIYTGWSALTYRSLLEMCAHLRARRIEKELWKIITARLDDPKAHGIPAWETFKVGAMLNAPKLCGRAVRVFNSHGVTFASICCLMSECDYHIPSRYLAALFEGNHLEPFRRTDDGHHTYHQRDWDATAEEFGRMKSVSGTLTKFGHEIFETCMHVHMFHMSPWILKDTCPKRKPRPCLKWTD